MPLRAVFFDIDGTLVDSNEFHVMAWQEAFHDWGHHVEKEAIRGQIGKGADQLIPTLLPGANEDDQKTVAERHGEIFRTRYLREVKAFPGATDLLGALHAKGKQVILASSARKTEVEYYVRLLKIESALRATVTQDDVEHSKPAGDIFAAALAQVFPVAASETIAVGDTIYDIESALRSTIRTIGLRSGGASEETLANAGAAYVFASVKELFDNFDKSPLCS